MHLCLKVYHCLYFFFTGSEDEESIFKPTFFKPPWFDYLESEYMACRRKVALLDYSSFTKLEVWVCNYVALLKVFYFI